MEEKRAAFKSYEKWLLTKELSRLLITANYSLYIYSL